MSTWSTLPTWSATTTAPVSTHVARRLAFGASALVLVDLAGGSLAVAADVNTWAEAWGSRALLAAPLPMIVVQVLLTRLAVRNDQRWAALPSGLLFAACVVSAGSGFFDGGLGNDRLSAPLVAFQAVLLTVTGIVGLLGAARARELMLRARSGRRGRPDGLPAGNPSTPPGP